MSSEEPRSDTEDLRPSTQTSFVYPSRTLLGDIKPGPVPEVISQPEPKLKSWPGESLNSLEPPSVMGSTEQAAVNLLARHARAQDRSKAKTHEREPNSNTTVSLDPDSTRHSSPDKDERFTKKYGYHSTAQERTRAFVNRDIREQEYDADGSALRPQEHEDESQEEKNILSSSAQALKSVALEVAPFNLAEYGLVHLPSNRSDHDSASGSSRQGKSSQPNSRRKKSTNPSGRGSADSVNRAKLENISTPRDPAIAYHITKPAEHTDEEPTNITGSSNTSSAGLGNDANLSDAEPESRTSTMDTINTDLTIGTDGSYPYTTVRFKTTQDENGNHVILGRQGQLNRCEDEPIHTPGAIQAYGVLIAVDDNYDDGRLVVRQVSENAADLLGLPPNYLFSLRCFTDALPDHQVNVLLDNLQCLTESNDPLATSEDHDVHIFMLSGYGQVGYGSDAIDFDVDLHRRTWTAWAAVHRSVSADNQEPGLIIIEIEIENDLLHPLHPVTGLRETWPLLDVPADPQRTSSSYSSSTETRNDLETAGYVPTPITTPSTRGFASGKLFTSQDEGEWLPNTTAILESTTSASKPIPALERMRRVAASSMLGNNNQTNKGHRQPHRGTGSQSGQFGMMDIFSTMEQINEQLSAPTDLGTFLKVLVGIVKDLTQFHRVMVYQFDEIWNGQVVAELVDWSCSHDLFLGLHFPQSDIPAQARELYKINKVRSLYDRSQPSARIVVREQADLNKPLNMTHCYLRAMSPIHLKYLENMGVRSSMSISIMAFGELYGLMTCHSYGDARMRVSLPVRQILRLLSQSTARNIERLSYARRLQTRKLINTLTSSNSKPNGYIVSNPDDLLCLFDADYGILVIKDGAKIMGPNEHGQEILIVAEYLRLKQFNNIQASQQLTADYKDLVLPGELEVIAGLLYIPLSNDGADFIAFLRKGQPRDVHWAGKPNKQGGVLEPRTSFKIWSETVGGRCHAWTDEQMETAAVLALIYGKFIEVWRQKQTAMQATKMTNLLLSNASHEVRTPLNHIINYLELALEGQLDPSTRENLVESHKASKSLLYTINDLLDLARMESGNEVSSTTAFNLQQSLQDATNIYRHEAGRRNLEFIVDISNCPAMIFGDENKIKTVIANLTANALKYTNQGQIKVHCEIFGEPVGLRSHSQIAVEIVVQDTGCGIPPAKLQTIFKEFEQVEYSSNSTEVDSGNGTGLGLGLAVVARIVEQLGGQLRVDSKVDIGSRFSFLIPVTVDDGLQEMSASSMSAENSLQYASARESLRVGSSDSLRVTSSGDGSSAHRESIDNLVEALTEMSGDKAAHGSLQSSSKSFDSKSSRNNSSAHSGSGCYEVTGGMAIRAAKVDSYALDGMRQRAQRIDRPGHAVTIVNPSDLRGKTIQLKGDTKTTVKLRVLVVEDNEVNLKILVKRLKRMGHFVSSAMNGQEGLDAVANDRNYDCILMDIQMPILDGYECTAAIRALEKVEQVQKPKSHELNGRIPIFAVSASLVESNREEMVKLGMDGWVLKPIDFKRLEVILGGVMDMDQRRQDIYRPERSWEYGGWLRRQLPTPAIENSFWTVEGS